MRRHPVILLAAALLGLCTGCTRPEAPGLDELMELFYEASGTVSRDAAMRALALSGFEVNEIAESLRRGRQYVEGVETGWSTASIDSADSSQQVHVYVPESYVPDTPHPLIVYLHGAVLARRTADDLAVDRFHIGTVAEEADAIAVIPQSDGTAPWWSGEGLRRIRAAVALAKERLNVDETRTFVVGFSDGASGAFWLAMQDPTPWAGFVPLYGSPLVGATGPFLCYPRNLTNRSLRAANGVADALFPASLMEPYVAQMQAMGVDIAWTSYPTGHDLTFFPEEIPHLLAFFSARVRDPHPPRIAWETSDVRVGRCDWVRIDGIAEDGDAPPDDVNLLVLDAQVLFGVYVDAFADAGASIAEVLAGFVAREAGVRVGDLLRRIDGVRIRSKADITAAMENRRSGDVLEIEVERDGAPLTLFGTIPEPSPAYPRGLTAARIEATADGNRIKVDARNVSAFTVLVSSVMFDLSQPIEVIVDGRTVFFDTALPDAQFMLEQAAVDRDRQAVYEARIEVRLTDGRSHLRGGGTAS